MKIRQGMGWGQPERQWITPGGTCFWELAFQGHSSEQMEPWS